MAELPEPPVGSVVAAGRTVFLREEDDAHGAAWRKVGHLTTYGWADVLAAGDARVIRYGLAELPGDAIEAAAREMALVDDERQQISRVRELHPPTSNDSGERVCATCVNLGEHDSWPCATLLVLAAGSVPVATPPTCRHGKPAAHSHLLPWGGAVIECPGPVANPTEPAVGSWGDLAADVMGLVDRTLDGEAPVPAEQPATCEHGSAEAHVFRFPGEYGTAAWCVGPAASSVAAEPPPTFEQLLTDPLEQFDTRSELLPAILYYFGLPDQPDVREALLRSIEEYRNAPPATASTSHMTRPAEQPAEPIDLLTALQRSVDRARGVDQDEASDERQRRGTASRCECPFHWPGGHGAMPWPTPAAEQPEER